MDYVANKRIKFDRNSRYEYIDINARFDNYIEYFYRNSFELYNFQT